MLKIARSRFVLDGKLLRNSNRYLTQNVIVQKEVQEAIHKKKPVLALESTIITHGMPYPNNLRYFFKIKLFFAELKNGKCLFIWYFSIKTIYT